MRITIHVTTRDRHSETALLLEALRGQTCQDWDLLLLDDASGTPVSSCYFLMSLVQRLQLEGHFVKIFRQEFSRGVCHARNKLIEMDKTNNPLICRLDDDCIPAADYLEKLRVLLEEMDYDLASGVIPLLAQPEWKRQTKFVLPIINAHELDENGNLIRNADDCGYCYEQEVIVPTHQFRTNAMFKRSLIDAGVRYPDFLTKVGFREEGFFSFEAILRGFKLGVHTGAVAHHLVCPTGGCRSNTYAQDVALDDATFRAWIKARFEERGNFLCSK